MGVDGSAHGPLEAAATLLLDDERLTWREVEGEVIVLERRTWTYLGINPAGTLLWKAIADEGATLPELVDRLCDAYGHTREAATRDARDFLAALRTHGLVRQADGV